MDCCCKQTPRGTFSLWTNAGNWVSSVSASVASANIRLQYLNSIPPAMTPRRVDRGLAVTVTRETDQRPSLVHVDAENANDEMTRRPRPPFPAHGQDSEPRNRVPRPITPDGAIEPLTEPPALSESHQANRPPSGGKSPAPRAAAPPAHAAVPRGAASRLPVRPAGAQSGLVPSTPS